VSSHHRLLDSVVEAPAALEAIGADTAAIGFGMASEAKTGELLKALAASKPGGRFLELGTGTGIGTAWLLAGMDAASRLVSVDNDQQAQDIARRYLAGDARVTFHLHDAAEFLKTLGSEAFDLIYADTWAGKFTHLDAALALLRVGGFYIVDDLLPQSNWPEDHPPKVVSLIDALGAKTGFAAVKLAWASGLLILVRTAAAPILPRSLAK
jgi:predicted O-methyltransferase YrrM